MNANLEVVIFDQDGVIADTERDGHRVAFNRAFKEFGLEYQWDIAEYGDLLKVGGGKERMRTYFKRKGLDQHRDDLDDLIKKLHRRKTEIFMEIIESGQIALRPGIERLVRECHETDVKLAVCSTSNERAVNTLVRTLLGEIAYGWFDAILAGDVVPKKKPDPAIYILAAARLSVYPERCVVIEDSRNGLLAAKRAGMQCVVTVNAYTRNEDFSEADLVVDSLGDPESIGTKVIASKKDLILKEYIDLEVLQQIS